MPIEKLSTRELQAYGAGCLAVFCGVKGIYDFELERLIRHLVAVLSCDNLPAWEAAGATLGISGRGDELQSDLTDSLAPDLLADLRHLVELVTEIGLVDMYGAATERPLLFAQRTKEIIEKHGIAPLDIESLFPLRNQQAIYGWGIFLGEREHQHALEFCLHAMGKTR